MYKKLIQFFLISSLISGILIGCSGVSVINKGEVLDLYGDKFLQKIGAIKEQYRQGQSEPALQRLKRMDEQLLLPAERALRRNLIGVILFSRENYEKGIFNFDLALTTSRLDQGLTAQIYLNLASSYYKLGLMEKAFSTLNISEFTYLQPNEVAKYHKLKIKLAKELDNREAMVKSMIWYLAGKTKISDLKADTIFEQLLGVFFKGSRSEKIRTLENFQQHELLVVAYLGYLEVEKLYYKGEKEEAKELMNWIEEKYSKYPEIEIMVSNFSFRVENYAKMKQMSIGIVLPLSGKKAKYGKRALLGIDSALRDSKGNSPSKIKLNIKDTKGSGAVGAYKVRELIEKNFVSVIIGGLFSAEATKEYLEARKHGVFFISLSQIYLPKDQKDHLLLEVPGSVESQVARVFSDEMIAKFGKRGAIIYPKSNRGEAYLNEFWRRARLQNIDVTGIHSYDKNSTDHRQSVEKVLGLKFKRERKEELEIISKIHSLEKFRSTRRIQQLKPQIDFDWLFMPAFPNEAMQLIPSFSYYDAFKLNLIGGPSWRSKMLSKESYKLGKLYFIGDNVMPAQGKFTDQFIERYKKRPRLIEMMGYDSYQIVNSLIADNEYETRDELDAAIRSKDYLSGITGKWNIQDGIWIKDMSPLKLKRGKIQKIKFNPEVLKKFRETEEELKEEAMNKEVSEAQQV